MSQNFIWKTFCNTENKWIETVGTIKPTYCINGIGHSVNGDSIQQLQHSIINTRSTNTAVNTFGESRVVERTQLIDLKSFYGVSPYRNIIGTTGTASVANNTGVDAEITLSITGANSTALLESVERGQYMAGSSSEVGIALRLGTTLTTNETLKFGYFDKDDGYYFKLNGSELMCCIMNNKVETVVSRDLFNMDKVDGTSNSLFNLDMMKGNIFHIDFSWYGYGAIIFSVIGINNLNNQDKIQLHRHDTYGKTSTSNPHLPISASLKSNAGSISNYQVHIGGRQYSIIGKYNPTVRYNSFYRYNRSIGTTLIPIISLRKITSMKSCRACLTSLKINTTVDVEIQILFDATLNSAIYNNPSNITESSFQQDINSTNMSSGHIIWSTVVFAGESVIDLPNDFKFLGSRPVTIAGRILNTLPGVISAITSIEEHW